MTQQEPLYKRDPAAWQKYLAEGNAKQPRKRVGCDVLIRDTEGRILIVNPEYKPDWDLPGGMAEANESPMDAVQRELREELGIGLQVGALLCVDWVAPHGVWDDSVMFVFDGGVLSEEDAARLQPRDRELLGFQFCNPTDAETLLRPYFWLRVRAALEALENGRAAYLQNGRAMP
jgi:8-oxo-dGTP pyrophosphatase MutT (NUDIX family)